MIRLFFSLWTLIVLVLPATAGADVEDHCRQPLYRFYHYLPPTAGYGDHFYTADEADRIAVCGLTGALGTERSCPAPQWFGGTAEGFNEGFVRVGPGAGSVPLYRLFLPDPVVGDWIDHFYTTSLAQRATALNIGYLDEGVVGWVSPTPQPGTAPLYRLFSQQVVDHFYTIDPAQRNAALGLGYVDEGIEGYVWTTRRIDPPTALATTFCAGNTFLRSSPTSDVYRIFHDRPGVDPNLSFQMDFVLDTGDFFSTHRRDHIALGLWGEIQIQNGIMQPYGVYGRGLAIGPTNGHTSDPSDDCMGAVIEYWTGSAGVLYASTCVPLDLDDDQQYRFVIDVDDQSIAFTVYDDAGIMLGSASSTAPAPTVPAQDIWLFFTEDTPDHDMGGVPGYFRITDVAITVQGESKGEKGSR